MTSKLGPKKNDRLDHFYGRMLNEKHFMLSISELSFLLKNTLIISHGNASVESSFFINKEFLVENLLEESLVNLR